MDAGGQKCYILRKGQSSWSDANTRCQSEGDTGLAIITSANENAAVQTVVTGQSGKAYIGLTDSATEGVNIGKWQHVGCDKSVNDNINFVCERKTEC